jgi:flagellar secretion chaperone FliS
MNGYAAYKKVQAMPTTRIDLILALYRKALENLGRAREALTQQKPDAARPLLAQTQLMVSAMATELPAYRDDASMNFLRLYEFVAHQMNLATVESVDAAVRVMTPLLKGFEAVREEALDLERRGAIPPLDKARLVSVKA